MKFKFLFVIITIMAVLSGARAQTYKDDKYTIILNVCGKVEGNTNNYSTPEKTVEGEKTCWRVNCKASNSDANGNEDGTDNYRKRCFSDTELFNSVSPSFNANMSGDVGILPAGSGSGSGSGNGNGNNNTGNGNGNGNGNVNNGNGNINGNGNVNINGDGNTVIVNMGDGTTIGVGSSHPCWNSCNGGKNGSSGCRSCCRNTVGADGYGGAYVMVDGTWWPSSCVRRNGKIRNRCLKDGSGRNVRGGGKGGVYVDGGSRNCTYTYSERECLGDEDYDLTVSGSGDVDCAECSVRGGGGGRVYKQHWLSGLADVMGAIAPPLAYFGSNWLWSNAYENVNSQWAAAASVGFEQCQVMQTNYIHSIYGNGSPGTPGYLAQNELPFQDLKPPGCNGYNLFGNFAGYGGGVGGPWGVGANPWMGAGYSPGFLAGMYGPYGPYSPWGGMGPGGVMGGTIGGVNIGLMGGVPGGMMAGIMSGYGGMAMAGYGGMAMAGVPGGMYGGMAMAGVPGGMYGGMAMAGVPGGMYGGMAMAGVPGGGIYGGFAGPGMGGMAMAGMGGMAMAGYGGMAMAGVPGGGIHGGFAGPGMGGMAMAGMGGMAMAGYGGFGGGGGPWGPWGGPQGNGTMPWNGCTSYWNCSGGGGAGMNWGAIQSEYGSNQQAAQQDWFYQQQALGNQYQNAGFNLWSHGYGPSMYGGGSMYGNQAFNPWNVGGSAGGYFGGGFYL